MPDRKVIRVFEYGRLEVGTRGFESRHWELLGRWAERREERYFEVWPNRIRFLQWVGVIEVDGLVIEVLPKAETRRSSEDNEVVSEKWRRILLSLLRVAGYLDVRAVDEARLGTRQSTLLDIVFSQYLDSLDLLLREGLVRRYRTVSRERGAVKGKIDHVATIRRNLIHAERFSTIAFEYDRINRLNLILKAATEAAALFAPSGYTRNRAQGLGLYFADWPNVPIREVDLSSVSLDRKTEGYGRPLALAKLILERSNPDLTAGAHRVFSLLFDMNDLWEKAILMRLRREAAAMPGVTIEGQRSKVFWHSDTGTPKNIRPDIVVKAAHGRQTILDTKWKVLDVPIPADQDLKQVFAYDLMWDANEGFLVFPQTGNEVMVKGQYATSIAGGKRGCGLVFSSVDPADWAKESLLKSIGIV